MSDPIWRKSSYSGTQGECVEVAGAGDSLAVRNSNHPDAGTIVLAAGAASSWVRAIRAGEYDDLVR